MGATVFNGARVGSIQTNHGVFYIWEENTHCIKDGPKHASWCVMAFGDRKRIVQRIYDCAASIPGGMLKTGQSATAFVDSMLKLLEAPMNIRSSKAMLENSPKGFYSAITDENRAAVRQYLIDTGRWDLASKIHEPSALEKGRGFVEFDLNTDAAALADIINKVEYDGRDINERPARLKGINPWRVFNGCVMGGESGPVEEPFNGQSHVPYVRVLKSGVNLACRKDAPAEFLHVILLNGKLIRACSAKDYLIEYDLIRAAGEIHANTGAGVLRKLLKAYKSAMDAPEVLDEQEAFTVEAMPEDAYYTRNLNALRRLLGLEPDGTDVTATIGEFVQKAQAQEGVSYEVRYVFESASRTGKLSLLGITQEASQEVLL